MLRKKKLNVWIKNNHMFMSIFSSSKFTRLVIGDRRPDTCNTIYFNGI
jgi:hypothetical protein